MKPPQIPDPDHRRPDFAHALLCPRFPADRRDYEGFPALFNWLVRARDWYWSLPRLQFEAMTFGLAVLAGLVVMPVLIYLAGLVALKAYQNGGLLSLYGDWFAGLFNDHPSFWIVVFGPFAFLILLRLARALLRKL